LEHTRSRQLIDTGRWRQLAEKARAVAEQMKFVACKMMMRVVEGNE
jgi:hypothetical protein